jgi:hypothetical protein
MAEKWFDRAWIDAPQEDKEYFERMALGPIPAAKGMEGMEKNAFERQGFEAAHAALNVFRGELGLDPVVIGSARLHVIEPKLYMEKFGSESRGASAYGHGYIARKRSRTGFLGTLTHELTHMASGQAMRVYAREKDGKLEGLHLPMQSGFAFWNRKPIKGRENDAETPSFHGLNEAVTELIAHDVRNRLRDTGTPLSQDEQREMEESFSYYPLIVLLRRIIATAFPKIGERDAAWKDLYRDYMNGEYGIIKRLDERTPGVSKILHDMTTEMDSITAAARSLGHDDIADYFSEPEKKTV